MIVECHAIYESEVGDISPKDLVAWLNALPEQAACKPLPMIHGKLWIRAEWFEERKVKE